MNNKYALSYVGIKAFVQQRQFMGSTHKWHVGISFNINLFRYAADVALFAYLGLGEFGSLVQIVINLKSFAIN